MKTPDITDHDEELEYIQFAAEETEEKPELLDEWKILVVDDDADVHAVTRLTLEHQVFEGKRLRLWDAYSAVEGRQTFAEHPDIALVLLDVVMETSSAGLDFVKYIREDLENHFVRIILRTGQPGYAPEQDVVVEYDIDDYKTKSELTATKLFTVIFSGLRTYKAFQTIDEYRQGLEQKVRERTQALEDKSRALEDEIQRRNRAETELRTLNTQLQESNASKDKFFSIIAHDLRGPFSGFLDITRLMVVNLDTWTPEKVTRMIHQIKDIGENLYALLENLLTWARFQQNAIAYYPENTELHSVVRRNMKLLHSNAEHKQISFKNLVKNQLSVYADGNMLDTVVRNLLSNALKFTEPGGTIQVSATSEEGQISVSVADTGIGIRERDLPKLFQIDTKFQRFGTADEPGTGLGLVLCKEFIERNGGVLWVQSEVGKGTTFTFSLPHAEHSF